MRQIIWRWGLVFAFWISFLHQEVWAVSVLILVPLACLFRLIFTMQFSHCPSLSPQKRLWGFQAEKALAGDAVSAYPRAGALPCLDYSEDFAVPEMVTFLSLGAVRSFILCFRICVFIYCVFHQIAAL